MIDDPNQDDLAAAWAAALENDDEAAPAQEDDKLSADWAAALNSQQAPPQSAAPNPAAAAASAEDAKLAAAWAASMAADEQTAIQEERYKATLKPQAVDAKFKDMTEISKAPRHDGHRRELDFILDIPLDVSAELGRTRLLINELLQLGQGSVVELNKLAGEPLEVFVNGKLVARGEAVVINEKFGVRLTDIISPIERVKQLA